MSSSNAGDCEGLSAHGLARRVADSITEQTRRPAVALEPRRGLPLDPLGSFLGGNAYWSPEGEVLRSKKNGSELRPLLQVRCADMKLEELPDDGLLQLFLAVDELFGCDFDEGDEHGRQIGWRVRYLADVPESPSERELVRLAPLTEAERGLTPFEPGFGGCTLVARRFEQTVSFECDEFRPAYDRVVAEQDPDRVCAAEDELDEGLEQAVIDLINEAEPSALVQVGGYPSFAQGDVRDDFAEDYLLAKLDSASGVMSWGDMGVADFFVTRTALARRDFSRATYTWDCC